MDYIILNEIVTGSYFKGLADREVYQCALSFLVACFLSIIAIPIIINLSNLLNLTAKPGFRSSHDTDTPNLGGIALYAATLIAFFLAEMGDKTQIATVALSAQFKSFYAVVTGTTLGMMIANVPAVMLGNRIAHRIPVRLVHAIAAAIFAVIGVATLLGAGESLGF